VALALPFLEAMLPRRAAAQPATPKRYVVCFGGMSLGRDIIGSLKDIVPSTVGTNFDLPPRSLEPLAKVKDDITIVSGLRIPSGEPGGMGSGGFNKATISPLLSGTRGSSGPDCFGPTSDQVVLQSPGFSGKRFLALRVQPAPYRGGGNTGIISWRAAGSKNEPQTDPITLFQQLFAGINPQPNNVPSSITKRRASVVDMVRQNGERLKKRLGAHDKARLERHFIELHELQARLEKIPDSPNSVGECWAPPSPGPFPPTVSSQDGEGYSGEHERALAMTDILVKAMACDLAHVATLQYTYIQCFMNVQAIVGVNRALEELGHADAIPGFTHEALQQKYMEMYGWHMAHFARLADGLRQERGPDGRPLLDNTVLVFVTQGGLGPAEGKQISSHSADNMMTILAGGRNLGLKPGRHIAAAGKHPAQVFTSAMNAVGVQTSKFGEVEGTVPLG
jgi:hypothetical protein